MAKEYVTVISRVKVKIGTGNTRACFIVSEHSICYIALFESSR